MAKSLRVKLVVMFVLLVVSLVLSACDGDGSNGIKNVVDCYNKTGMGTTCVYQELKGNGVIVNGDEGFWALLGLVMLAGLYGLMHSVRPMDVKVENIRRMQAGSASHNPGAWRRGKNW